MLTPHCSAASGMVAPPSIVPTTRLRRSAEYGFAIPAGLLPAGSLNHIRAAMGIPDSAFSGNALMYGYCVESRHDDRSAVSSARRLALPFNSVQYFEITARAPIRSFDTRGTHSETNSPACHRKNCESLK